MDNWRTYYHVRHNYILLATLCIFVHLGCESDKPTPSNSPPYFTLIEPNDTTIFQGDSVYVNATAEDPDNDILTYLFIHNNDTLTAPHWFYPDPDNGVLQDISYKVTDGNFFVDSTKFIVFQNILPVCNITSPDDGDTVLIGNINIAVEASDEDGQIEYVEFYVDEMLLYTDLEYPYDFTYTDPWFMPGDWVVFKAIAVDDNQGLAASAISTCPVLFMPVNPHPDTIFVPQDYSSIQEAVDNSLDGDVIMVSDGIYIEHIHLTHPLILVGNGENTIIERCISVYSDNVIIMDLKVRGWGGVFSYGDAESGISIRDVTSVLVDNIIAIGGVGCYWWDPLMPELIMCTWGGSGIRIENSSGVIIQNSELTGGEIWDFFCGGGPGSGLYGDSAASVFVIESRLEEGWPMGRSIQALNNSYIGARDCEVIGDLYNDATSTIIFP